MIRIRVIHGSAVLLSQDRFAQVKEIFSASFPTMAGYADKIPGLLRDPIAHGYKSVLLVAETARGRVDAFALVMHFPAANCCFLDYIASRPGVRGSGVGGALYEATREFAQHVNAKALYLEVDPDEATMAPTPDAVAQCRKRIQFYERYGVRIVGNTRYHEAVGNPPVHAFLLYDSLGNKEALTRADARLAVEMILTRRFGHIADAAYIRNVVESFTDDPVQFQPRRTRSERAAHAVVKSAHMEEPFSLVLTPRHEIHHVRERGYFERPIRHEAIRESLGESPLFSQVKAVEHGEKPILAVHDAEFVHYLRSICAKLKEGRPIYPDTFPIRRPERRPKEVPEQAGYYCIDTGTPLYKGAYLGARAAVDTALTAADEILAGRRLAYAACRPPGHHAGGRFYGGFCYFNNAAIAARFLSAQAKVAILDIDYHHGNGTQDIFYDRDDVLTISVHGDPDHAYPYFSGYTHERGEGAGLGFNRNFPLPPGTEETAYLRTLNRSLDLVDQFGADVLVVALGFDILKGDPTGRFLLKPTAMRTIGERLIALGKPLLFVQEGGYNIRNIRRGVTELFRGASSAAI